MIQTEMRLSTCITACSEQRFCLSHHPLEHSKTLPSILGMSDYELNLIVSPPSITRQDVCQLYPHAADDFISAFQIFQRGIQEHLRSSGFGFGFGLGFGPFCRCRLPLKIVMSDALRASAGLQLQSF